RINVILHGLEADLRGGKSTITDPQFLRPDGSVDRFDVAIANFPFSQEFWWLTPEQRAAADTAAAQDNRGKRKTTAKPKMPKEYKDPFGRFVYGKPPAS